MSNPNGLIPAEYARDFIHNVEVFAINSMEYPVQTRTGRRTYTDVPISCEQGIATVTIHDGITANEPGEVIRMGTTAELAFLDPKGNMWEACVHVHGELASATITSNNIYHAGESVLNYLETIFFRR